MVPGPFADPGHGTGTWNRDMEQGHGTGTWNSAIPMSGNSRSPCVGKYLGMNALRGNFPGIRSPVTFPLALRGKITVGDKELTIETATR